MANDFYYYVKSNILVGGGPQQWYYSPEQQEQDAMIQDKKVKVQNERAARPYQDLGVWYPQTPTPLVENNPTAAIFATYV